MDKLELLFFGKQISLEKRGGKIIINGINWDIFKKIIATQTLSSFEITKYNFLDIKNWNDILNYFTYLHWNPNIKVISKLQKRKHTIQIKNNLIIN